MTEKSNSKLIDMKFEVGWGGVRRGAARRGQARADMKPNADVCDLNQIFLPQIEILTVSHSLRQIHPCIHTVQLTRCSTNMCESSSHSAAGAKSAAAAATAVRYVSPNAAIVVIDDQADSSLDLNDSNPFNLDAEFMNASYVTQLHLPCQSVHESHQTHQKRQLLEQIDRLLALLSLRIHHIHKPFVHPLIASHAGTQASTAAVQPAPCGALKVRLLSSSAEIVYAINAHCADRATASHAESPMNSIDHFESAQHMSFDNESSSHDQSISHFERICIQHLSELTSKCTQWTNERRARAPGSKACAPVLVLHLGEASTIASRMTARLHQVLTHSPFEEWSQSQLQPERIWQAHMKIRNQPVDTAQRMEQSAASIVLRQLVAPPSDESSQNHHSESNVNVTFFQRHTDNVRLNWSTFQSNMSTPSIHHLQSQSGSGAADWLSELAFALSAKDKYGA